MVSEKERKIFESRLRYHGYRLTKFRYFIVIIEISIKLIGVKRTINFLNFFSKKHGVTDITGDIAFLDNLITIFNQIKDKKSIKGKCLAQSLTMQFVLQKKAIETNLIIGGELRNGYLYAHAWLEKEGVIINDHPSIVGRYQRLKITDNYSKNIKF